MTSVTSIEGLPVIDDDLIFGAANAKRMERTPALYRKAAVNGAALFVFKKNGPHVNVLVKRPSVTVFEAMPNPVPYRGVSIGTMQVAPGVSLDQDTVAVASNGQVLGRMAQDPATGNPLAGTTAWNGAAFVEMFNRDFYTNAITSAERLTFAVPEDCIYPTSPWWKGIMQTSPIGALYYNGVGHTDRNYDWLCNYVVPQGFFILIPPVGELTLLSGRYSPDTAAFISQIDALNDAVRAGTYVNPAISRRKAWFKKNSDTVLAQLKSGVLPDGWDYALKLNAPTSTNTYRDPVMTADVSVVEETAILPDGGSVTVFHQTVKVDGGTELHGTMTMTTERFDFLFRKIEYQDWYVGPAADPYWEYSPFRYSNEHPVFVEDVSHGPLGAIVNGVQQQGKYSDSTFYKDATVGQPGWVLTVDGFIYASGYYVSALYPTFSNSLVVTTPQFVLDYRNSVKPKYAVGSGNQTWNDSAMTDKMVVTLTPYAPLLDGASLGMFHYVDPDMDRTLDDAYGATQIEIYGSARFVYNYATGAFTFLDWTDDLRTIDLPAGIGSPHGNCMVLYSNIYWPDLENIAPQGVTPDTGYYDAMTQ